MDSTEKGFSPGTACPLVRERNTRLWAILIFLAVWLLYLPAVNYDYTDWDDHEYLLNPMVCAPGPIWMLRSFTRSYQGYYAPTLWLTYRLGHSLWGLNSAGFHALNILLHSLNAVLVLILCRRLGLNPTSALLAALLWALHPLRVESVAWISELKDVLSGAGCLLAMLWYIRAVDKAGALDSEAPFGRADRLYSVPSFWLAVAAFGFGVGAKATVCTWPLAIGLVELFRRSWPQAEGKSGTGDFDRFTSSAKAELAILLRRLPCVSIAPFGWPVVPEV